MKVVKHKNFELTPMHIVGGDVDAILQYIWDTSDTIKEEIKIEDLTIIDQEKCFLDPGGLLFFKIPYQDFSIEGQIFAMQPHRAAEVLPYLTKTARERIPGYIRFRIWDHFVILSKNIHQALVAKVTEISKSDAAFHAELDVIQAKEELEARKICRFRDVRREPPHEKRN